MSDLLLEIVEESLVGERLHAVIVAEGQITVVVDRFLLQPVLQLKQVVFTRVLSCGDRRDLVLLHD